jgi:uncharacterized membrane protein YkvA (DUF1232 family)
MEKADQTLKAAKRKFILSLTLLVGGIVYTLFPMDFIPDILGPLGWIDDLGLLLAACANAAISYRTMKHKERQGDTRTAD